MSNVETIPELKQIIGAMLFAAREPVSLHQVRHVLEQTAEQYGGFAKDFADATDEMIIEAVKQLNEDLTRNALGIHVREVANGYRLANDANCGPWLRIMLEKGKATRLSRPALETLAIIAYRQPVVRSEIEAVRGVAVDQIIRNLLDLQLIRVVGRSDLPGRPWLFGTTQKFLEHFGIKSLNDLPGTQELRRLESEQIKRQQQSEFPIAGAEGDADAGASQDAESSQSEDDEMESAEQMADENESPENDESHQFGEDDEYVDESDDAVEDLEEVEEEEEFDEDDEDEYDDEDEFDEDEDEFVEDEDGDEEDEKQS